MKKILLGAMGLIAVAMTAPALAADFPAQPQPYTRAAPTFVAAIYDWTGYYLGFNGGGGWAHKCWNITNNGSPVAPFSEGCHDASGAAVGGQLGYRWQAANWVFGLEAQADWTDFKGSNVSLFGPIPGTTAPLTNQTKIGTLGLFTGQVGYAWDSVLWYVKGGGAFATDTYRGIITSTNVGFDRVSETRWGGVVGTGLEFGFSPNWSVAVEYDHIFMGNRNVTFTAVTTGLPTRTDNVRQDVDMATVRVNWRWGGPVIAKY